jgi:hypothetical protein|nr:MAG TPA: hypothetical protein [Caudoviricetes sp.]
MKHSEIIKRWSFLEFLYNQSAISNHKQVGKTEITYTNNEGVQDSFVLFNLAGKEVSVGEKCKKEIKSIDDLRELQRELVVVHCILSDKDEVTGELTNPKEAFIICKGREMDEVQEW